MCAHSQGSVILSTSAQGLAGMINTMDSINLDGLNYEKAGSYYRAVVFDHNQMSKQHARFQVIKVPPGQTVEAHYHQKRTEVFVVLRGQGEIYINDRLAATSTNDIALCQPNDSHKVINGGETDLLIGVFAVNYFPDDSHS